MTNKSFFKKLKYFMHYSWPNLKIGFLPVTSEPVAVSKNCKGQNCREFNKLQKR